eukprot:1179833-Prorocentrum_minimum.AAC.6
MTRGLRRAPPHVSGQPGSAVHQIRGTRVSKENKLAKEQKLRHGLIGDARVVVLRCITLERSALETSSGFTRSLRSDWPLTCVWRTKPGSECV